MTSPKICPNRGGGLIKRLANILTTLLIVAFTLIAVFNIACYVKRKQTGDNCPTVLGLGTAIVASGSMEDRISVNDLVVFYQTDDYAVGDVVTYCGNNHPITHRIVSIRVDENGQTWITTRGDANNTDDDEFPAERIIGEVVAVIPAVGRLQSFLQTPGGVVTVIGVTAVLLLWTELLSAIRRRRE